MAGYAYGSRLRGRPAYQWSAEVSAYIHANARRQGVGRALYTSLFAVLVRQGYCNAYAGITLPNDPSVRFHESLGFETVGVYRKIGFKFGAWHDVGWWQMRLAEKDDPPAPRGLSALSEDELEEALAAGRSHLRG